MRKYQCFFSLLIALSIVACGTTDRSRSQLPQTILTFPDGIYELGCGNAESAAIPAKRLLYYFDGNCALCYGKVKTMENIAASELGGIELVFIARTARVHMFRQNVLNARIKSCIQIDSLGIFEGANPDKTYLDQMAVLDQTNSILIEGNLIADLEVRSSFKRVLK